VSVNPAWRFGAPETGLGPSGVGPPFENELTLLSRALTGASTGDATQPDRLGGTSHRGRPWFAPWFPSGALAALRHGIPRAALRRSGRSVHACRAHLPATPVSRPGHPTEATDPPTRATSAATRAVRRGTPTGLWSRDAGCTTVTTAGQTVRRASVGDMRAARIAGSRPAAAPIRMAAPRPPVQAMVGITTVQSLVEA
jgi:hypothetical protein